ncbi:MAG: hypothetical protein J7K75_08580 [Desulfuromonas sp.]|nr:hypothetical protein [Desulfuromonas sp.]
MSGLDLGRFRPELTDQPQRHVTEPWDAVRADAMIRKVMAKAVEAVPAGALDWAEREAPELFASAMVACGELQRPFDDKDLAGVRSAARNYAAALKSVIDAFEADCALSGTQHELVMA